MNKKGSANIYIISGISLIFSFLSIIAIFLVVMFYFAVLFVASSTFLSGANAAIWSTALLLKKNTLTITIIPATKKAIL